MKCNVKECSREAKRNDHCWKHWFMWNAYIKSCFFTQEDFVKRRSYGKRSVGPAKYGK
jgi:hypothetical protein